MISYKVISNKKRRAVAAELRKLAAPGCIRYAEEFYEELREIVAVDLDGSFDGVANSLADLIDCPTCEMEGHPGARYGRCSRCGAFVRRDAVTDCIGVIPVKFCPNCRAEVLAGAD